MDLLGAISDMMSGVFSIAMEVLDYSLPFRPAIPIIDTSQPCGESGGRKGGDMLR